MAARDDAAVLYPTLTGEVVIKSSSICEAYTVIAEPVINPVLE